MSRPITPLFIALTCAASAAHADRSVTVSASRSSWYSQGGNHNGAANYFTGWIISGPNIVHHSYFVFPRPAMAAWERIGAATLRLENPSNGFGSPDSFETAQFVDVVTPVSELISSTGSLAIYNDLGSGVVYGQRNVSAADNGTVVAVPLNADAVVALNAVAPGGSFAIGAHLTTMSMVGDPEFVFANTGGGNVRQLSLTLVPEPVGAALLAASLSACRRRRTPNA